MAGSIAMHCQREPYTASNCELQKNGALNQLGNPSIIWTVKGTYREGSLNPANLRAEIKAFVEILQSFIELGLKCYHSELEESHQKKSKAMQVCFIQNQLSQDAGLLNDLYECRKKLPRILRITS